MDAIPSLCACTASCGAASIGYVYGQTVSDVVDVCQPLDASAHNGSTIASPRPPAVPHNTPSKPNHHPRPQSASIPRSVSPWGILEEESTHQHSGYLESQRQSTNVLSPEVGGLSADGTQNTSPSWTRRVSTIAQSHDGSSLSSQRPSSPSLFSNGSNAPFLPSNQVVTPRNRLVKRSTSHRVLHSATYNSSPLSPSQTPTFRRPATSHQRSEQLRLQSLQRGLETPDGLPPPQHEQTHDRDREDSKSPEKPIVTLRLYFEASLGRFFKDTSIRSAGLSRGHSPIDSVWRVQFRQGGEPQLLKPAVIQKSPLHDTAALPPSTPTRVSYDRETPTTLQLSARDNSQHKGPRARHSFSFGDMMSTPTPSSWKIRRGGSIKKNVFTENITGRRIVSAPQKQVQVLQPKERLVPSSTDKGSRAQTERRSARSTVGRQQWQSSRTSSSPLPPLDRLSAFEIDIPGVSRPESPPQWHHRRDSFPIPSSPGSPTEPQRSSSLHIKPHRSSRIPSDRASTVFSSDNEHSRVFSADGDDLDCRSETVYDSIRTDATSSSHSGAKGLHAENVFQRPSSPEPGQRNLNVLHDKLARVSLGESSLHGHFMSKEEDDEPPRRPLQTNDHSADGISIWSPRTFPLSSSGSNALTPSAELSSQQAISAAQADQFWPIEEEDSNWGDTESMSGEETLGALRLGLPTSDSIVLQSQRAVEDSQSSLEARHHGPRIQPSLERDGRTTGRRTPNTMHLRSQSVPLAPETPNHRFNNISKLETWMLGGKGVSEDWDGDFEFEEPKKTVEKSGEQNGRHEEEIDQGGVLVPPSILERQASVHGQFGQVKELTQLVEELRELHRKAHVLGILHSQSAELWREAEGIIDLATLDEDEVPHMPPHSPNSSSFDFEGFEEDASISTRTIKEGTASRGDASSTTNESATIDVSPQTQQHSTPNRPRKDSIAQAKTVLEHIHQQRPPRDPLVPRNTNSPRKLPFDTTSLRDLVVRAGVVTRALAEIVKRLEHPERTTPTTDRQSQTPPNPAFSQIFQNSPTPPASRRSPRMHRRRSSNGYLQDSPSPTGSERKGHMQIMSVV